MTHWLAYGGGVNSTALAVLLCEGKLPHLAPWRCVWADVQDEKDETYEYVDFVMRPYLRKHGVTLETVRPPEGVIERWERLKVTGSRMRRSCSDHGKMIPLMKHMKAHSPDTAFVRIIGIDAGERHRAKDAPANEGPKVYPLVDMDIDREGCERIIREAGLTVPPKSGCWHCPFMRVGEVLELAVRHPERMRRVVRLETVAAEAHGRQDAPLCQWNRTPAIEYAKRACAENTSGPLFQELEPDPPCGCYDG